VITFGEITALTTLDLVQNPQKVQRFGGGWLAAQGARLTKN
jgi:hypothetical protein